MNNTSFTTTFIPKFIRPRANESVRKLGASIFKNWMWVPQCRLFIMV